MNDDGVVSFPLGGTIVRLDEDTLRERPDDPGALARWCAENPGSPQLVVALRILGRLEEAERAGREALADPWLTPLQRAARRGRLATVLHWQARFDEAEEQFAIAAEETGVEDPLAAQPLLLLATILQHRAKSRLDQAEREAHAMHGDPVRAGRLRGTAEGDARRALAIRENCGASPELLASSRQTLRRVTAGH